MRKYLILVETRGIDYFLINCTEDEFIEKLRPSVKDNMNRVVAINVIDEKVYVCRYEKDNFKSILGTDFYSEAMQIAYYSCKMKNEKPEILDYRSHFKKEVPV